MTFRPSCENFLSSRSEDDDARPLLPTVRIHAARVLRPRQFPRENQDSAAGHRQVQGGSAMVGETGNGGAVSKFLYFFLSFHSKKSGVVQWLGCLAFTQETRVRIPASELLSKEHRNYKFSFNLLSRRGSGRRRSPRPCQRRSRMRRRRRRRCPRIPTLSFHRRRWRCKRRRRRRGPKATTKRIWTSCPF